MAYSLGFAHGRITLTYNGGPAAAQLRADLLRIMATARAAHGQIQGFAKRMDKMTDGLLTAASAAGKVALGISGITHAVVLAAVAAQTLGPIFAAVFAALPGIVLGGVVALGVFKIATKGVGDALKAAGGDAKEFDKAIKGLSPQAQKFARSWRDAGKALAPIQRQMQDAFFKDTGPQVGLIAKRVGVLRAEAVGAAEGFNQVFRRVLEFTSSGTAINTVRSLLNGVRAVLLGIAPAIKPLLTGFFNLARQAGEFGDELGGGVAAALVKFGNFLNGVNLEEVFDGALEVLRPMGTLLAAIGSIIGSVFSGLAVEGAPALGTLGAMVTTLADFLKTAEGQEGLNAIGEAFVAISGATGQVFLALLKELTPVIIALAPGIAQLAQAVADVLVPALGIVGPILTSVAGFLSRNMDVIAPLIIGIYALSAAMKIYTAAAGAAAAIQAIWNSALLASAIAWVRTTAAMIASTAATVYHTVVTKLAAAGTAIWTAIQWLFNVALVANPIGIVVVAIIALIAIIVIIATKTTWFQTIWNYSWGLIKQTAKQVGDWFANTLWPLIKNVFNWIVSFIAANIAALKSIFNSVWGAISAVIGFFTNLRNAVFAKIGEVISFLRGLPGQISSALGSLGSLLYEKGQVLVDGFINGIKSMFGKLRDTAANLAKTVTDFLPGSPAKKGPLSGRGWTPFRGVSLVEGLEAGMQSQLDELARMAAKVAAAAVPVMPTLVGGAGMSSFMLPAPQPVSGTQEGGTVTLNQTVNALPGMSAMQVADYSNRRLVLGLRTGASVLLIDPPPTPAGA